jgi:hypothetical protein
MFICRTGVVKAFTPLQEESSISRYSKSLSNLVRTVYNFIKRDIFSGSRDLVTATNAVVAEPESIDALKAFGRTIFLTKYTWKEYTKLSNCPVYCFITVSAISKFNMSQFSFMNASSVAQEIARVSFCIKSFILWEAVQLMNSDVETDAIDG